MVVKCSAHIELLFNPKVKKAFTSLHINNSKKLWNGTKEIVQFGPKINQKIVKIIQNETELTDPKQVANAFNNYFANVGVNLARLIPKKK